MTNKEAIETLKANYPDACFEQLREAVDTAISALQAQDVPDTNVGDTIYRQAAINIADDLRACISVDGYWAWTERLKKLPSAQPEQRWIPVTERLPENSDNVLVYFNEGFIKIGHLGTHVVEDNNFRIIGNKKVWYTDQYYYDFDAALAWMPLPKWKGEADAEVH